MDPIKISLPIYIQISKKTKFALNLNEYRNTHFQILNKAKVLFEKQVKPLISHLPKMSELSMTFTLFLGSKRLADTANICCIVDKFFSDTLVNCEIIPDDNYTIIKQCVYEFGDVDPHSARVEVTIRDYVLNEMKEEPMKITLIQSEIEDAIKAYALSQISVKEDQEVKIEFKATRGDDGATAEIIIGAKSPAKPVNARRAATPTPEVKQTEKPAELGPVEESEPEQVVWTEEAEVPVEKVEEPVIESKPALSEVAAAETPVVRSSGSLFGNLK